MQKQKQHKTKLYMMILIIIVSAIVSNLYAITDTITLSYRTLRNANGTYLGDNSGNVGEYLRNGANTWTWETIAYADLSAYSGATVTSAKVQAYMTTNSLINQIKSFDLHGNNKGAFSSSAIFTTYSTSSWTSPQLGAKTIAYNDATNTWYEFSTSAGLTDSVQNWCNGGTNWGFVLMSNCGSASIYVAFTNIRLIIEYTSSGDRHKANNTTALNQTGSWVEGVVPTQNDTAVWDNTVTAANTVSLAVNQSWNKIKIENPGGNVTINSNTLTLGGGGIDMSSATQTLLIESDLAFGANQVFDVASGKSLRLNGAVTGAYSITKNGLGNLFLQNNSTTYSGGTTISGGTLIIGATGATGVLPGDVTNNAALEFRRSDAYTYAGVISGTGTVTNDHTGTVTLSANQTYTGATSVTAGTLKQTGAGNDATATSGIAISSGAVYEIAIGHATRLSSSAISITGAGTFRKSGGNYNYLAAGATAQSFNMSSGGLIDITGGSLSQFTTSAGNLADLTIASGCNAYINDADANSTVYFDALSGAGLLNIYNITNPRTVVLGVDNGSGTFSGVLSNTGTMHITKQGTGTQTFSGNNTYQGNTTISSGVLNIQNSSALGSIGAATSITSGAALQIQGAITTAEDITVNGTGISNTGAIRNMADDNTISGDITIGSASYLGNDVSNFLYIDGDISGSATITKVGNGPIVFRGAKTYTGATVVNSHILWIENNASLGTTAGNTTINSGASLGIYDSVTLAEPLVINGNGAGGYGAIYISSGESFLTGTINVATASRIYSEAIEYNYIDGVLSGSGAIEKSGSGPIVFRGNNTYTGATTVSDGRLWLKHNNALGNTSAATTVSSGASLVLYNGLAIAEGITLNGTGDGGIGALNSNSSNNSVSGNITLGSVSSIGVTADTLTIGGVISGANNFTKVGVGVLLLEGTNTFSGNTNISAGELRINGSTSNSSAISISSSAILSGDGSAGGFANLSPNAVIEPGDGGPGKLTFEDGITFVSTCTLNVEIGTNSDTLAVIGGLTLDGILNIDSVSGFAPGDYVIATYTGAGSNSLTVGTTPNGDYTYSVSIGSGEVVLSISDNSAPTAIALSSSNVDEQQVSGAVVGVLSTTDPDVGDSHTYSLAGGELDNALFAIDVDSLETGTIFDYENGEKSYQVSIITNDGQDTFKDTFTITINNDTTFIGNDADVNFSAAWSIGGGAADVHQLSTSKYFDGHLDEVRIESSMRSADWIKFCYETQKLGQTAVTYVQGELVDLLPLTVTNNVGAGTSDTIMVYTDSFTVIFDEDNGGGIKWLSAAANKGGTNQVTSGSTVTLFDVRYYTNSYSVPGILTLLESNSLFAKVKQEISLSNVDFELIYTVYGDGKIFIDISTYNSSGSDQSNTLIFRTYRKVVGTSNLVVSESSAATADFLLNADDGAGQFDILLSPFGLWSDASGIDSGTATDARIGYRDVSRVLKTGYQTNWSFLLDFGHKSWNDTSDDVHTYTDAYQQPDSLELNRGTKRMVKAWEEKLLLHYTFDQDISGSADGDTVEDYSEATPTLYNGVIEGGTWSTGKWGDGALTLASADSIAIINASSLDNYGELTITAWVDKSGTTETGALIFGDDNATTTGFKLTSESDKLQMFYAGVTVTGNSVLGTDWVHVAATVNKHNGWIKLFVNGKVDTVLQSDLTIISSSNANNASIGNGFAGNIDDIRVYSKEISEETIYSIYNLGYRSGQGMYSVRCDNNSSIDVSIDGSSSLPRYNPIFELTNYWGTAKPIAVYYDGLFLDENDDYICALDDATNTFYIGFKRIIRANNVRFYIDDFDSTGAWTTGPTKKMVWGTSGSDFYVQNFEGTTFSSTDDQYYLKFTMPSANTSNGGEIGEFKSSAIDPSTTISSAANVISSNAKNVTFGYYDNEMGGVAWVKSHDNVTSQPTYTVLESSDVRIRLQVNDRTCLNNTSYSYDLKTIWTIYPTGQIYRYDSIANLTHDFTTPFFSVGQKYEAGISSYAVENGYYGGIHGGSTIHDFALALLSGYSGGVSDNFFMGAGDTVGYGESITGSDDFSRIQFEGWTNKLTTEEPFKLVYYFDIASQNMSNAYIDSVCLGASNIVFDAGDMTTGTRLTNTWGDLDQDGFNESEGTYTVQADNNTVEFKIEADAATDRPKFYPAIKISNYYASYKPKFVHLYDATDTATLVEGYQYNCYLNKSSNELIIQLDSVFTVDVNCYISDDEDLAVTLSEFKAEAEDEAVNIVWRTESELENAGFNIHRRVTPAFFKATLSRVDSGDTIDCKSCAPVISEDIWDDDTLWIGVNRKLIPGASGGNSFGPLDYSFYDSDVYNYVSYDYLLEVVDFANIRDTFGPITVTPIPDKEYEADESDEIKFIAVPNPVLFREGQLDFYLASPGNGNYTLTIFDHTGTQLFSTEGNFESEGLDPDHITSWDLKFRGRDVGPGGYIAVLNYISESGISRTKKLLLGVKR